MNKIILVFVMILTGCATPVADQYKSLDNEGICCTNVSIIPKTEISVGQKISVPFRRGTPVYDFGAGKTYTAMLELPANNDYHFIVRSFFNGFEIGQFFQPIYMSFDKNYQAIEVFTVDMKFVPAGWVTSAHMGSAFKLSKPAKYLAVFTSELDREAQVANIPPSTSVTLIGDIPIVSVNPGRGYKLTPTPTGTVKFELKLDKDIPKS